MAAWTLAQAQEQLDAFLAANLAVAQGQSCTIGSRSLTRADGKYIDSQIRFWRIEVQRLSSGGTGGIRIRGGTPT